MLQCPSGDRAPVDSLESGNVAQASFALCFPSLFDEGRGFAFPCDAQGQVNLDELSERGRNNYLFARALVGRDFAVPSIRSTCSH